MKRLRPIALAILALASCAALAEEQSLTPTLSSGFYISQGEGFVVNISAQPSLDLLKQTRAFEANLKEKAAHCVEDVEKSRFKTRDALITLIMPGGLIWAASRHQQHLQAQQRLAEVNGQIDELETDLDMLETRTSHATLALLK